jgi:hypothetical protein
MTRRVIMGAGAIVAVGFLVGSAAANFMFGMSLGRTSAEGVLLGSIGVCAVATNALCPFFLSWSIQESRKLTTASIMLLYVLCLIYSVTSAAGFAAQNREGVSASRQIVHDAYADTGKDLAAFLATNSSPMAPSPCAKFTNWIFCNSGCSSRNP